ncbi:MAG: helix-turn-helix transcriptional regulator [Flavobacteriaceae bacterium]|nr:helix-turn-helix transcriptional regulator [Flavobacteriaceae bacterium]
MINTVAFSERLKLVMDFYQLTSAAFAEKIDVQPSTISHLLSGRNKPSLEFILKVLENFREVELYWLLNGKGSFPKRETVPETVAFKTRTSSGKEIDRIIIFFKDGTFQNYIP